ncbi:MAG TPA: hypothetical protein IAC41_11460, partial [Candidatus Merdenecus merdavium]|nr:hypothetical protein [Candidatus Merdenecus merdavium]
MNDNDYYNIRNRSLSRHYMSMNMNPYERPLGAMEEPVPFYQVYQMPGLFDFGTGREKDSAMVKSMYPKIAKEVQMYVEEECDKMEYDGSLMFDDYPDKERLRVISQRIYEQVKDNYELEEDTSRDEMLAMNR